MDSGATKLLLGVLITMLIGSKSAKGANPVQQKQWCIADERTTDDALQKALDWACGFGGADCKMIQPKAPCYLPNTVRDHASYAFNSYWQKLKHQGGTCYFNSAAKVTEVDPSHPGCQYESVP